jgi:rubrerythrin
VRAYDLSTVHASGSGTVKVTCKRCGHTWALRWPKLPPRCPSCHSRRWRESAEASQG